MAMLVITRGYLQWIGALKVVTPPTSFKGFDGTYVDNKVISGCESKHHWLTYNMFSHVKMDWWPWHQYEYSNLSKSWAMAQMETSYSTETIANPCLSIWRRVCLTNMIQEFIKIIIPNHCPDGGLTARTGDIGAESRPLSLFFFICQMTQR